jgi:transcriptional regulator with XRE-family HTH domain
MRHVIADVRIKAGLSQAQLSEILDCSVVTVQRIEQGTLSLSENLAKKAQKILDVSADWLLANNPKERAVTPRDDVWTKDSFELTQQTPPGHSYVIHHGVPAKTAAAAKNAFTVLKGYEACGRIRTMLERTKGLPKQGILLHRLNKALNDLEEDFNPDKTLLEELQPKIGAARKAFEKILDRNTEREMKRIWRDGPNELKK